MFARAVGVTSIIAPVVITDLLPRHILTLRDVGFRIGAGTVVRDYVGMCQ